MFIKIHTTTVVVINLRGPRIALGLSQSRLARISGVSRYKICTYELGDGALTMEEWNRVAKAISGEADRLRSVGTQIGTGSMVPLKRDRSSNEETSRDRQGVKPIGGS